MKTNGAKYAFIDREIQSRRHSGRLRALRNVRPVGGVTVNVDGRELINFCSNDYLGLSRHPLLQERSIDFMRTYGAGSTASRLVCGNLDCFEEVENKLARLKGTEAALIFPSGYQTNVSLPPALADRQSLILSDRLNHNSIINGCRLARCKVVLYEHNDLEQLRQLLTEHRPKGYSRILIVTESIFSMDGDQSDITALSDLADEFGALLIVDEAHATGVMGHNGMGLACGGRADLAMGTFSKAAGSFGAYVACSQKMKEYLINCCAGLIYTTGVPPAVLGAMDAALDLIPRMTEARARLLDMAQILRSALVRLGYDTGLSTTQIVPVIVGPERETMNLSRALEKNGILATAIRPPTVPEGQARIRLALSADHTPDQIDRLMKVVGE